MCVRFKVWVQNAYVLQRMASLCGILFKTLLFPCNHSLEQYRDISFYVHNIIFPATGVAATYVYPPPPRHEPPPPAESDSNAKLI